MYLEVCFKYFYKGVELLDAPSITTTFGGSLLLLQMYMTRNLTPTQVAVTVFRTPAIPLPRHYLAVSHGSIAHPTRG